MYRISPNILRFALALLAGATLATFWVNLNPNSYYDFIEWRFADLSLPQWIWSGTVTLTPYLIVTDLLMAVLFFVLGKELWEAIALERGALHGTRALLPAGMTLGGMLGAGSAWLIASAQWETAEEAVPGAGWAAPLGSDTMLVCLFGLLVFGRRPALYLVMLLAIATDIAALLVLGFAKLSPSARLFWLLLPLGGALYLKYMAFAADDPSRPRQNSHWISLCLAGAFSWFGVAASGLPASLGLLPLLPAITHADRSFGLFSEAESLLHDPLNRLVTLLVWPTILIVFLFGLIRGGLDFMAFAPTTWVMLAALWLGRPLGILAAVIILGLLFQVRLPRGLRKRDLVCLLVLLSMGFSVPIVAIEAEVPGGMMREAARLGLGISLIAGPIAICLSRLPSLARPLWRTQQTEQTTGHVSAASKK